MKEFMLIFRHEAGGPMPTPEQMQAVMKQWQDWIGGIAAQGKYSGTNRLNMEGKTLKPGNVILDGPYAEVKEIIGGYLIVKAGSFDEAVEMAKACPHLLYGGNVEVRGVMNIEYDTTSSRFLEDK